LPVTAITRTNLAFSNQPILTFVAMLRASGGAAFQIEFVGATANRLFQIEIHLTAIDCGDGRCFFDLALSRVLLLLRLLPRERFQRSQVEPWFRSFCRGMSHFQLSYEPCSTP